MKLGGTIDLLQVVYSDVKQSNFYKLSTNTDKNRISHHFCKLLGFLDSFEAKFVDDDNPGYWIDKEKEQS